MRFFCRDVMDKLAAALAGYGSHLPDTTGPAAAAAPGLDPDLALELARQAGRDSSLSGGSNGSNASAARQGWRGVGYVRVDGSHDSTERLAAVKKFKQDPSCRVALLSITAAAVGEGYSFRLGPESCLFPWPWLFLLHGWPIS
jgi:hypothetical protein